VHQIINLCYLSEISFLQLTFLDLSGNRITALPVELRFMTSVVQMNLEENPLSCPPANVSIQSSHLMEGFPSLHLLSTFSSALGVECTFLSTSKSRPSKRIVSVASSPSRSTGGPPTEKLPRLPAPASSTTSASRMASATAATRGERGTRLIRDTDQSIRLTGDGRKSSRKRSVHLP
jgi:hypothetical protein